MTYVAIDTSTLQGKKFLELLETLPFATIYKEPNDVTKKAISDAKKGKTKKASDINSLLSALKK
jgi:antitoxin component of RelBE/YafQ-DinJ toxin-antitoxin module